MTNYLTREFKLFFIGILGELVVKLFSVVWCANKKQMFTIRTQSVILNASTTFVSFLASINLRIIYWACQLKLRKMIDTRLPKIVRIYDTPKVLAPWSNKQSLFYLSLFGPPFFFITCNIPEKDCRKIN